MLHKTRETGTWTGHSISSGSEGQVAAALRTCPLLLVLQDWLKLHQEQAAAAVPS